MWNWEFQWSLVAVFPGRYIEAMVHCASSRHPAAIVDDLHCKVLRDAVQNSKTSFSENVREEQGKTIWN